MTNLKETVTLHAIRNSRGETTLCLGDPPEGWTVEESHTVEVRAVSYIETLQAQDAATTVDPSTGLSTLSASRYMLELLHRATGLEREQIAALPKAVGEQLAALVSRLSDPNLLSPSGPGWKSSTTPPDSPSASS